MKLPHPWRDAHERHERLMRQLAWNNRPRKYFDLLVDGEWVGPVELGDILTNETYRTATSMRPAAFMEFD